MTIIKSENHRCEQNNKCFNAKEFVFEPPRTISRAWRVLIKPCANMPLFYPHTTSRQTLEAVIKGIRKISDADIIFMESSPRGQSMRPIYDALKYDFPRVLTLDVKDCTLVEVENPLPHPFACATFWLPNVLLSCYYLISVAPFKVVGDLGYFTIPNLLGLLPISKYQGESGMNLETLYTFGIHKVIADLYFTLPFDLGIIDARQKFTSVDDETEGEIEDVGKILVSDPYKVDQMASNKAGITNEYLELIAMAKSQIMEQGH